MCCATAGPRHWRQRAYAASRNRRHWRPSASRASGIRGAGVSVGDRADVPTNPESTRLEALWSGAFGDAYTERNKTVGEERQRFWRATLDEFPAAGVLEVGCNLGANLRWIASAG